MSFVARHHNLIASLCVVPFQVATFAVYVYRGTTDSPFVYTTKFNGFLFVALSLLASFFVTFAVARLSIARKTRHLTELGNLDFKGQFILEEARKAVESINAGIGLCGISIWTLLLPLCFVALDLPSWLIWPFLMLYIAGLSICTEGVRIFNQMLNPDIADELIMRCSSAWPQSAQSSLPNSVEGEKPAPTSVYNIRL
jgi:hypothetical protein